MTRQNPRSAAAMDLETVLCSPQGFGLERATFLQRIVCRLTDGAPLDDLLARATDAQRAAADRIVGCPIASVPGGEPPLELVDLEPVRCGKSLRYAALAVARSQTIDVSIIRPGQEPPRISLLSTATDTANTLRGHLNAVHESPALRSLVIGDTADSITLRHPSGLPVQLRVIAAHRGGYSLASRWAGSVIFDEAPGWYSTDRVVSLEESREQVLGRLLPGAQAVYGGSPWQPAGFCYETYSESFGRPSADLLVMRAAPAWELNPIYWTPERVERIKRRSPRTYLMHLLAEFGSAQNSAFDMSDVEAAFNVSADARHYGVGRMFLAVDPSSLAGDAWAWSLLCWRYPPRHAVIERDSIRDESGNVTHADAIVRRDEFGQPIARTITEDTRPVLHVCASGSWSGDALRTVTIDSIVRELSQLCHTHGVDTVVSDQREAAALESMFRAARLRFVAYAWTNQTKDSAVVTLRRLLQERRMWIAPDPVLRQEMLSYGYKLSAGGKFVYGGRHGHDDRVSTLITFCHALNAQLAGEYPPHRYETPR